VKRRKGSGLSMRITERSLLNRAVAANEKILRGPKPAMVLDDESFRAHIALHTARVVLYQAQVATYEQEARVYAFQAQQAMAP